MNPKDIALALKLIRKMMNDADYSADMDSEVYKDWPSAMRNRRNGEKLVQVLHILESLELME